MRNLERTICSGSAVPGFLSRLRCRAAPILVLAILASGCATGISPDDPGGIYPLFLGSPVYDNTLTFNGVTLSIPETFRFESAYQDTGVTEAPAGVLFRFRDGTGRFSGTVQQVTLPEIDDPGRFILQYYSTYLDHHSILETAWTGIGTAVTPALVTVDSRTGRERCVLVYAFPGTEHAGNGVIFEAIYPAGDPELRSQAAGIANSLRLPELAAETASQARRGGSLNHATFADRSGHWRWITDLPGGLLLRLREPEFDLYVAIQESGTSVSPGRYIYPADESPVYRIEVLRGAWRWQLSVARIESNTGISFKAVVPADPDNGTPALELLVHSPDRIWITDRSGSPVYPPERDLILLLQDLMTEHVILR